MDFAGWFPTGPLTSLFALVVFAVTIPIMRWGDRPNANIAVLLFLSWAVARTATWADAIALQGMGTIAIMGGLWLIHTRAAMLVMCLAAVKLVLYGVQPLGVMNIAQMWAFSEVFAYIQLIVLFGGTINAATVGFHLGPVLHRCGLARSIPGLSTRGQSFGPAIRSVRVPKERNSKIA